MTHHNWRDLRFQGSRQFEAASSRTPPKGGKPDDRNCPTPQEAPGRSRPCGRYQRSSPSIEISPALTRSSARRSLSVAAGPQGTISTLIALLAQGSRSTAWKRATHPESVSCGRLDVSPASVRGREPAVS